MINFIYSIIIIFLAVSTSLLIFCEIKQKSRLIKFCLLLVNIVLFIILILFSNIDTAVQHSMYNAFEANIYTTEVQSEIIESNNSLLRSIVEYLDSGKDSQLLIDEISLLIEETNGSYTLGLFYVQYDWQKQIKSYKKLEDQMTRIRENIDSYISIKNIHKLDTSNVMDSSVIERNSL